MAGNEAKSGLTGGCQCGAIRYRFDATPIGADICHCRMCQKAGGAPFMAFVRVARESFVVTEGQLAIFASSAIGERGFCSACGTPLTYSGHGAAHLSATLGSLDDPNAASPESQLGVESRVHWLPGGLSLPAVSTDEWLARNDIADVGSRQHPDHET